MSIVHIIHAIRHFFIQLRDSAKIRDVRKRTIAYHGDTNEMNTIAEDVNTLLRMYAFNENADTLPQLNVTNLDRPPIAAAGDSVQCRINPPRFDQMDINCRQICNDPNAEMLIVREGQSVRYNNTELELGVYCVAEPFPRCSTGFGVLIYNVRDGWDCLPTHPHIVAGPNAATYLVGQHPEVLLRDRRKNGLVNQRTGKSYDFDLLAPIPDFDHDHNWTVECNAETADGYFMYNLPGTTICLKDYCSTVPFGASYFNGEHCICASGTVHQDEHDMTSPCVSIPTRYEDNHLKMAVPCFTPATHIVNRPAHMPPCFSQRNPIQSGEISVPIRIATSNDRPINITTIHHFAYSENWKNRVPTEHYR